MLNLEQLLLRIKNGSEFWCLIIATSFSLLKEIIVFLDFVSRNLRKKKIQHGESKWPRTNLISTTLIFQEWRKWVLFRELTSRDLCVLSPAFITHDTSTLKSYFSPNLVAPHGLTTLSLRPSVESQIASAWLLPLNIDHHFSMSI